MNLTLGTDSNARKKIPLWSGCIAYFVAALAGVARHSMRGNDKHNPGQPLHHARGKSMDHADCIERHLADIGDIEAVLKRIKKWEPESYAKTVNTLLEEADALSWRSLALSQQLYETYGGAPLAPNAVLPEDPNAGWDIGSDFPQPNTVSRFSSTKVWTPAAPGRYADGPCINCGEKWGKHAAGNPSGCPNPDFVELNRE